MNKLNSFFILASLVAVIISCKTEPKEKAVKVEAKENVLDVKQVVKETKILDNGISISWIEQGKGERVKAGDVIMIDYKVRLKDSSVIDGNHLLNKESLPFMVGFQMQSEGWDIALQELNVGDFAYIKLPSKFARGTKGIKGLVPPNSDNYLAIRVLSKSRPTRMRDGNKVWVFEESKKSKLKFNETNKIIFHSMVSSPSSPLYFNSFRTNVPFELRLEDNGLVPGLKKALINAKKGDRMFALVPSSEAYGAKGYVDIVKPNEDLFYNILVMDVVK